MAEDPKCPVCGSRSFYVRDPADEFDTHEFTVTGGEAVCGDAEIARWVAAAAESYCSRCSWHGKVPEVNRG